jgi:hypothetical protein
MDLLRGIVKPKKTRRTHRSTSGPEAIHLTEDGIVVNRGPSHNDSRNLWTTNRPKLTTNTGRQTRNRRADLVVGTLIEKSAQPKKLNKRELERDIYFAIRGNKLLVMSGKVDPPTAPPIPVPDPDSSMLSDEFMEAEGMNFFTMPFFSRLIACVSRFKSWEWRSHCRCRSILYRRF